MRDVFIVGSQYWAGYLAAQLSARGYGADQVAHRPLQMCRIFFQPSRNVLVVGLGGDLTFKKFMIWAVVTLHWVLHRRDGGIILYWIGGDVVAAKHGSSRSLRQLWAFTRARHIAGAPWFVDELRALGVNASPVLFPYNTSIAASMRSSSVRENDQTTVCCYLLPSTWESQYGARLMRLASLLPDTSWTIMGMTQEQVPVNEVVPDNVEFLGWVGNPLEILAANDVYVRLVSHDAYSGMVRDAQAMAKTVLYNMPVQGVVDTTGMDDKAIATFIRNHSCETNQRSEGMSLPPFHDQIQVLAEAVG
ncbi:hypothetical protein PSQ90_07660 [Devosia rhodophyticola]|uniref:Polysaccharide pyruvyl transferase domain-containing protein n=1 Tax=Devosia rhodophyticola TaxID=3026423 RepID=A0ABY7Z256_9HYPH|nr:hypothetical protein [Devosia rhodophyticola]WDR07285.1 hypothetical protein PSQ90_07660 [Devosia rhodophyticola]